MSMADSTGVSCRFRIIVVGIRFVTVITAKADIYFACIICHVAGAVLIVVVFICAHVLAAVIVRTQKCSDRGVDTVRSSNGVICSGGDFFILRR